MKNVYAELADALNALPNGFPRTETGSDLRLLEFMYTEKEAELASRLTRQWETASEIAERLGKLTKETLSGLFALVRQGKVWMNKGEGNAVFRLAPFVVGSYEASNDKMNKEMALLFSLCPNMLTCCTLEMFDSSFLIDTCMFSRNCCDPVNSTLISAL